MLNPKDDVFEAMDEAQLFLYNNGCGHLTIARDMEESKWLCILLSKTEENPKDRYPLCDTPMEAAKAACLVEENRDEEIKQLKAKAICYTIIAVVISILCFIAFEIAWITWPWEQTFVLKAYFILFRVFGLIAAVAYILAFIVERKMKVEEHLFWMGIILLLTIFQAFALLVIHLFISGSDYYLDALKKDLEKKKEMYEAEGVESCLT